MNATPPLRGHPLLVHASPQHRRRTVAGWVSEGLRGGEQVVVVDLPLAELHAARTLLRHRGHDVDALTVAGQLRSISSAQMMVPDGPAQVVLDALDAGWSGVRLVGPPTDLVPDGDRARYDALESTLGDLCARYPVSVLCQHVGAEDVTAAACHHRTMFDAVGTLAWRVGAVRLSGEFDSSNAPMLRAGIAEACRHLPEKEPLELSVTEVDFVSIAAARAVLDGTRDWRRHGGEVLVRRTVPRVGRLFSLLGLVGPGAPLHAVPSPRVVTPTGA